MSAEITQGTQEAVALQDAIQQELIQRSYSTEGDNVMAEFVFVMLCNQKTPSQITSELQELIGPDFEESFTTWLFDTVAQHYPNSKAASHSSAKKAPAPQPQQQQQQQQQQKQQSSQAPPANLPARPSPFGNVAAGVKRGHNDSGRSGSNGPPSQRQRVDLPDNVPKGPRNPQPTDGDPSMGPSKRSLSERMGGPPPGFVPTMTPMGPMFINPQTGQAMPIPPEAMEQFTNGGDQQGGDRNQRNQRGRGRGRGRDSNNNNRRGDHQQQQQQQQAPMMFPPGAMPMFFAPGPNGQPQPFFPQQQQQMFPFSQQPGFPPHMAQAQQQQQQQPPQLPSKPSESGLCKYATECKNAYCKFAHPSPAASKESGLVLSDETCEKQISCEDADCPKSHVSPQQKDPSASRPPQEAQQAPQPFPQPYPMMQPPMHPQFGAQSGVKPCKFGASCTRPDCMFQHPWNNPTPCRFGVACTRPDCYFSHPPGRKRGGGAGSGARGGYANKGNRTAVFNQSSTEKSVDEKLKENEAEKQALNERMKRFSGGGANNTTTTTDAAAAAPAELATDSSAAPATSSEQTPAAAKSD